jgi:PAS domain S-box-containing protein
VPTLTAFFERVSHHLAGLPAQGDGRTPYREPSVDPSTASREALLAEIERCRARIAELEAAAPHDSIAGLFGGLLEAAPDGIVISDHRGVIRVVNPAAERLFGYDAGELVGNPIEILVPDALRARHMGRRTAYTAHPTTRRMGIGLQLQGRRKDGSEVPTEISLSPLETSEGRFIVSAIRDVGERRDVERMLQHQATLLAHSNDQLQQFAYVASHDLQEPLRMVSSYLQLLERRYGDKLDDDAREFIRYAVDGARRMQALIQDLLAYSRIGAKAEVFSLVDLDAAVQRTLRDLDVAIAESGASIQVDRLPTITAEATQIGQLLLNLIGNALKFHLPGEAPRVEVRAARVGDAWELTVEDHGIGLDPQYRDRIFQIFQRLHTRQEYPGTGIGLAICKRIAERHGGAIRVDSAPGRGARFTVVFPDRRPA